MSAMTNTTPIVTTVTKPAINPREADATPKVNIHDFCEEYYEDILPIIMDKVRRDKRKEIHARLDFGEGSRERRTREGSHYSSARTLSARPERLKVRDRLRYNDEHVLDRLEAALTGGTLLMEIVLRVWTASVALVSHMITPTYETRINHGYRYRDRDRFRHAKRGRDSESPLSRTIEDFMERFKVKTGRMKGALECMRIFGFMHGVNNSEFTKRLNEHVSKTMEEMMITTIAFIRGEAVAVSKKKGHTSWRTQDQSKRKTSKKRSDFRGQPKEGRGSSRFTPLTRIPKEILATEARNFQPPPPIVTPVEKKSSNKFCDFHNDKGHSTNEYMQLKKQIEELVRTGKLSHLIREIKQGWDQSKVGKKEAPAKDKPAKIYMIESWQRMTRQKVTQSFERVREITFPSLATSIGTEGPLVIEAEISGHMIHRMYVDRGSSMEVLYEHCFNQLRPKVKNQMIPTITSLTSFSGIVPLVFAFQKVPSTLMLKIRFLPDFSIHGSLLSRQHVLGTNQKASFPGLVITMESGSSLLLLLVVFRLQIVVGNYRIVVD
uniref:Reverse transcriptase domain-containing protein n=1 Tax=Tanacetum cinerariifolium TaxID=118510 RepID=A0A6L2MCJ9_TANCI|nr:reverse transcriptase domain-containing protein [Tanacetum cinerariifolium]